MEITDSFRVSTPLPDTWNVLLDIEGIAPCLPGAQLQEIEGNEFRGIVKVKVGPITAQYKGTATLSEVDETRHRIVIDASGRDTRGQGNASASIVVTMSDDGAGTAVSVATDLSITGKVAQFGRGVLADVSAKLLRQFVENLERDVLSSAGWGDGGAAGAEAQGAPAEPGATTNQGTPPDGRSATSAAPGGDGSVGPRKVESRDVEPIDLFDVAGQSAAKRVVPLAIGVVVMFVLWRLFRGRRG